MSSEIDIDSSVLLRTSDIDGWKNEWESIDDNIKAAEARVKELRSRRAKLSTYLNGAAAFAPDLQHWLAEQEEKRLEREARDAPEDVALTDAILKVLKRYSGANRDTIRQHLPAHGYSNAKIQANPNYLYTAIARLITRGQIVEDPAGHYKRKG